MNRITLKANAKINLCLYITAERQDGYHEIDSIFQSIDLFDWVELEKSEVTTVTCDNPAIPCGADNICLKAVAAFNKIKKTDGVKISIQKNIPVSAGLGGGSADAAAVIVGMNALFDCGLSQAEFIDIGRRVGADVPFFLVGGCARAQGIGEVLTPVVQPFSHDIVVIKPDAGVSTPAAYRLFDETQKPGGSAQPMLDAFIHVDELAYLKAMQNALQPCAFRLAPESQKAAEALIKAGALKAMVSGSGAAVFGLFRSGDGQNAFQKIKEMGFKSVYSVRNADSGIIRVQETSGL